jgi:hypothetical protein
MFHRADPIPGRREVLHPCPQRAESRYHGNQRPRRRAGDRQLPPADEHPWRPRTAQHRTEPRAGREARSLRGRGRPTGREGRRVRRHHPAIR